MTNKPLWIVAGITLLCRLLQYLYTPYITEDGPIYLDMAFCMSEGDIEAAYSIYPLAPPSYPFLLACLVSIGFSPLTSCYIVACLSNIFIVMLVYFIAKKIVNNKLALLASLLAGLHPQMYRMTFDGIRETIFIPLTLLSLYLAILLWEESRKQIKTQRHIFLISSLIGLLFGVGLCTRKETLELCLVVLFFIVFYLCKYLSKKDSLMISVALCLLILSMFASMLGFIKYTDVPSARWVDDYTDKIKSYWEKVVQQPNKGFDEFLLSGNIIGGSSVVILAADAGSSVKENVRLIRYIKEVYKATNPVYFYLILCTLFVIRRKHLQMLNNPAVNLLLVYVMFMVFLRFLMYMNIQAGGALRYLAMVGILGCIPAAFGLHLVSNVIISYMPRLKLSYFLIVLFLIIAFRVYRKTDVRDYMLPMAEKVKENQSLKKMVYGTDQNDLSRINFYAGIRFKFKMKEFPIGEFEQMNNREDYYYVTKRPLDQLNSTGFRKARFKLLHTGSYKDRNIYLYQAQSPQVH